jgi:iron-sulfur cluster assembly protein/iron-sulfur cluster insertion protein
VAADDVRIEHGGIAVVIDPASAPHWWASLDFNDGLQGAGFAISNPNASRSCGCGQSFS